MLKKILLALLCVLAPTCAWAQTATVSGNLKDAGAANITGSNTFARFTLENYVDIPKVVGTNVIAAVLKDFHPDASGNISGTIQENNSITSGGVVGNTFYRVCLYYQGQASTCNNYQINSNFNLSSATPLTNPPQQLLPPAMVGTTANLPATCTLGQVYFATDASAGQNLYFCTAANTWTQQPSAAFLLSANNAWTGNETHSGTETFTGVGTICKGNGTAYLDTSNTCGWSGATPDLQIASIATYLGSAGGLLYLGPGTFLINAQLTITTPIKMLGAGSSGNPANSPLSTTILNCNVIAGPCIQFSSVSGASNIKLQGAALERAAIQCNDNAQIGLDIESVSHSSFRHILINSCTVGGFHAGVVASLNDARDDQYNDIEDLGIVEGNAAPDASGYCMKLDGDPTANFSGNIISDTNCTHKNGHGIWETNTDDNLWLHTSLTRAGGGTGIDVYLNGNGTLNQSPREETFVRLGINAGGYTQDNSSTGNRIYSYSNDTGGSQPVVNSGSLFYTQIGVGSTDVFDRHIRATGSTANMQQFDTSTAGLGACTLYSDVGVSKYQVCKDSNNNYYIADIFDSLNVFQSAPGGATAVRAPSGQNVQIIPGTGASATSSTNFIALGTACTNGELALSPGWQSTGSATVTAVAGNGQTCSWTITTGTTTAANPTITDTLTNALPAATTVCEMNIHGGTHTAAAGEGFQQTTLSATAPVFTFNGTPTANGFTYFITRRCGP